MGNINICNLCTPLGIHCKYINIWNLYTTSAVSTSCNSSTLNASTINIGITRNFIAMNEMLIFARDYNSVKA